MQKYVELLVKAGFTMNKDGTYGTIQAEPLPPLPPLSPLSSLSKHLSDKDCYNPRHRDIFISSRMSNGCFFYVTSHIKGSLRHYRSRTKNDMDISNIFSSGKTKMQAVKNFLAKYKQHVYRMENYEKMKAALIKSV